MTDEEKKEDNESAEGFLTMLEKVRELLSAEGGDVGLCQHCMDTNRVFVQKGAYTGVEGREDNKIITTEKCFHDAGAEDDSFSF